MKMPLIKYMIACLLLLHASVENTTAQTDRSASIIGYAGVEYRYFSEMNARTSAELKTLDSMYDCYVSFRVDTMGRVIDLSLAETLPNRMPALLVNYIKKIFYSSSGKWLPQIKDSRKVVSDELVWYVDVLKANQTINERATETESIFIRKLNEGINQQIEDRYRNPLNRGGSIVFSYYGDKSEPYPTNLKQ